MRLIDLTGKKFGKLKPLKYLGNSRWLCECECGNNKEVINYNLTRGFTKSCGCFNSQSSAKRNTTHGMSESSEYNVWSLMIKRCTNEKSRDYIWYGGQGIRVCDRWINDFSAFYEDMGARPSRKHSIDRINIDGDYDPNNCRWATQLQQANNKRNNHFLTAFGETKTIAEWSRDIRCLVSYTALRARINDRGWNAETAITCKKLK